MKKRNILGDGDQFKSSTTLGHVPVSIGPSGTKNYTKN